jgi:hypothetical protein
LNDSLKFSLNLIDGNRSITDTGIIIIELKPLRLLIHPLVAIGISAACVFLVTLFVSFMISHSRMSKINKDHSDIADVDFNEDCQPNTIVNELPYKGSFWDIIREGDYYPSLAKFQFFIWTTVLAFIFLSVYLIRISGGETSWLPVVSQETLGLLGISIGTATLGNAISRVKYDSSLSKKIPRSSSVPKFYTLLIEGNKPVLYRYQLFIWTVIGIGIYLSVSFAEINAVVNNVSSNLVVMNIQPLKQLKIANVEPTIVAITGLSQAAYLAGKFTSRTPVRITSVYVGRLDRTITIFGDNFKEAGQGQGIVLVDNDNPSVKNFH